MKGSNDTRIGRKLFCKVTYPSKSEMTDKRKSRKKRGNIF